MGPAEDKDGGRGVALSTEKRHSGSAEKQLHTDVLSDPCIQVLNVTTSNFTWSESHMHLKSIQTL